MQNLSKENKKPMVRSTMAQIKFLINYMAQNPSFAAGEYRGPLGAAGLEEEWARLQSQLAELGPDRTIQQWKHCWRDQKKKARAEGGAVKRKREQTGNSTIVPELSQNSEMILGTIGHAMATGIGPAESPIGHASAQVEWLSSPSAPFTLTQPTTELLPTIIDDSPCPSSAPLPMGSPTSEQVQNNTQPECTTPMASTQPSRERLRNVTNIGARRRRRENPSDRFLNAQYRNNELLKKLVEKIEESNEIKKESNKLKQEELMLRREELEIKKLKMELLKSYS